MEQLTANKGGCHPPNIQNWIDLQKMCPRDPQDLIADIYLNGVQGQYKFSGNYLDPGAAWSATPITVSAEPSIFTLGTDNQLLVANANQWNFDHLTWNSASALAIPLRNYIFLRGGTGWVNRVYLNISGTPIQELQLSFLINAATRGGMQGLVPVIYWDSGSWEGEITLEITLHPKHELFHMGLWAFDGANYSMIDLTFIVRP